MIGSRNRAGQSCIVQILPDLLLGGAQEVVVLLSSNLTARGLDVTVMTLHADCEERNRERLANVKVLLPNQLSRRGSGWISRAVRLLSVYRRLVALSPSVVHSHQYALMVVLPYIAYRKVLKRDRSFVAVHTIHSEADREFDSESRLQVSLAALAYRMGVIGVACGERVLHTAQASYPGVRFHVINNGVETLPRSKVSYSIVEPPRMLCVGRLVRQKNFGLVIEAGAILRSRGTIVKFTIVGEGPLMPDLQHRVTQLQLGDRVELVGSIPQVVSMMDEYDALCLPSLYEGLPMVVLEAAMVGLPVIADAIPSLAVLGEGIYFQSRPGPIGLADAIMKFIELSPAERETRAGRIREWVVAHDSRAMIDSYCEVYVSGQNR